MKGKLVKAFTGVVIVLFLVCLFFTASVKNAVRANMMVYHQFLHFIVIQNFLPRRATHYKFPYIMFLTNMHTKMAVQVFAHQLLPSELIQGLFTLPLRLINTLGRGGAMKLNKFLIKLFRMLGVVVLLCFITVLLLSLSPKGSVRVRILFDGHPVTAIRSDQGTLKCKAMRFIRLCIRFHIRMDMIQAMSHIWSPNSRFVRCRFLRLPTILFQECRRLNS